MSEFTAYVLGSSAFLVACLWVGDRWDEKRRRELAARRYSVAIGDDLTPEQRREQMRRDRRAGLPAYTEQLKQDIDRITDERDDLAEQIKALADDRDTNWELK